MKAGTPAATFALEMTLGVESGYSRAHNRESLGPDSMLLIDERESSTLF